MSATQQDLRFDGDTYEEDFDKERLSTLFGKVRQLMLDGRWRTLEEISSVAGGTEASCSARLRDLRKERFGSWTVDRRPRGGRERGLFEYRLVPREEAPQ